MRKVLFYTLTFLFALILVLIFRPVATVKESSAIQVEGRVGFIKFNKSKDINIRLINSDVVYYINRGTELDINLLYIRDSLINKYVKISYPDYWTPLDWDNKTKHISRLEVDDRILFDELKK